MRFFSGVEVDRAASWLAGGGLLVFPTETFYGVAVDPRRREAVGELRALKQRDRESGLSLIAGSLAQVDLVVPGWRADPRARVLADVFWPGPLTLVLPGAVGIADGVATPAGTVAIRWSSCRLASLLARAVGFPLVSTSANLRGDRPATVAAEAHRRLGSPADVAVLDGGEAPGGKPSTILALAAPEAVVVREGAIGTDVLNEELRGDRIRAAMCARPAGGRPPDQA